MPPPLAERGAAGRALRDRLPRSQHGKWKRPSDRPDPIDILRASDADRLPELVPIRYGRMLASPFAFYRGAAGVMAADLAKTPTTGHKVQACGDCHLMNFGGFATPERNVIFDINDFDETLPAPWEWDVKRLVASFVLAARSIGLSDGEGAGRGGDLRAQLPRAPPPVRGEPAPLGLVRAAHFRRSHRRPAPVSCGAPFAPGSTRP